MKSVIRSLVAASIIAAPLEALGQGVVPDAIVDELMASLKAFECEELPNPLLLTGSSEGWGITGLADVDLVETINGGYRLGSTENKNFLGFLQQEQDSWVLMLFDASGVSKSTCEPIDEVVAWVLSELPVEAFQQLERLLANEDLIARLDFTTSRLDQALIDIERLDRLLAETHTTLMVEEAVAAASQREVELLNQQVADMRSELGRLQALLNLADERVAEAEAARIAAEAQNTQE